jgi:hypothetical protein
MAGLCDDIPPQRCHEGKFLSSLAAPVLEDTLTAFKKAGTVKTAEIL